MPKSHAEAKLRAGRLFLICNPRSGRVSRRLGKVRRLGRALAGERYLEVEDIATVGDVLADLRIEERDVLGLIGGDGTVATVLTALHAAKPAGPWPPVFPIPGGSTNMTAYALGSPRSLTRALRWLGRVRAGEAEARVRRHCAIVVRPPGAAPVCGMFFGVGAVSDGVKIFRERLRGTRIAGEHNSGLAMAGVLLSEALRERRPGHGRGEITTVLDGGPPVRRACFLVLVSVLDRHVLGLRPYWGTEEGPLHYTRVDQGADPFWTGLPLGALGRPTARMKSAAGWTSHNASRVELTFDGPFALDGELYEGGRSPGGYVLSASYAPRWLGP